MTLPPDSRLTLHEQPDDGVGSAPVVDQTQVVAGVAGRDGVDAHAEDAQRDRDPVREAFGNRDGAVIALVGLFGRVSHLVVWFLPFQSVVYVLSRLMSHGILQ